MPEFPMFSLSVERSRGRARIILEGELDMVAAPNLVATIDELLGEDGLEVVVDLRALTFMDSSGLQALLHGHARSGESRASFSLIRGGDNVMRVFELSGIDGLIPFARPVEAA
jgi:anti-anti-sigma factor